MSCDAVFRGDVIVNQFVDCLHIPVAVEAIVLVSDFTAIACHFGSQFFVCAEKLEFGESHVACVAGIAFERQSEILAGGYQYGVLRFIVCNADLVHVGFETREEDLIAATVEVFPLRAVGRYLKCPRCGSVCRVGVTPCDCIAGGAEILGKLEFYTNAVFSHIAQISFGIYIVVE